MSYIDHVPGQPFRHDPIEHATSRAHACRLPRPADRHVVSKTSTAAPREVPAATQVAEAPTVDAIEDNTMLDHPLLSTSAVQAPPEFGTVNRTGINGLTACGTEGLETVRL